MVPSCTRPPSPALHFFFLHCPPDHRDLHSFPTRRSSDLLRSEFEMLLAALIIFAVAAVGGIVLASLDRKSTRLNSSHVAISYAVFCLKKKNARRKNHRPEEAACSAQHHATPSGTASQMPQ